MKKSEFKQLVKNEIDTIKSKATKEEKDLLDFSTFSKKSFTSCIYGQMTGNCDSERARELFPKCYEDISDNSYKDNYFRKGDFFTHLELFLFYSTDESHESIIKYIKGESEELILKFE